MHLRASAYVCGARPHGETGVIARLLTAEAGLVGVFVAGGRGRHLRPLLIPGNRISADIRARSDVQLPFAHIELLDSRGPWLGEPLPAAAIAWVTALTASTLPERHPYPALYDALGGLLDAICMAPSARGWAMALLSYEVLLLRELGYGVPVTRPQEHDWAEILAVFDTLGRALARYPLADRGEGAMATRAQLRERLARIEG